MFGFEGVFDFIDDFRPDDDVGECAELRDPASAHKPGKHGHVDRSVKFAGAVEFVWTGGDAEFGQEVGEGWGKGELASPLGCSLGELAGIAVWADDIHVPGMERWDGDGAAPEDKVLGKSSHLSWREDVAGLLANLIEGKVWFAVPDKLNHGQSCLVWVILQLRYDSFLVGHEQKGKVLVQEAWVF